ncbi:SDR family oxidoreductase [Rhizobium sp. L43]|uniref:SDR family oxidoreductase n=1 Tax=Rhizobium sp. L43 TaxID=2035452 RepID=UPI000BE9553C|nr:SDR family oxidoreductase [Rhizobium sp. L43]PDS77883.1 oxidoreductase [Rhizobium sp. L43]
MKLTDNTILITGGASGIGLALAQQLSERGNRVIICGRSRAALDRAQAAVPALITRVCDVTDLDNRDSLSGWLENNHPDLNMLINNAGVQHIRHFDGDHAVADLDQEIAVNLAAPIQLIGELLPMLKRQPSAVIVNVTSGLAFTPKADIPVYCATKAALHSFTLSLRHQLKATGVRVVEMVPPMVDTNLGGGVRAGGAERQYMMSPEQFATEALAQLENDQDELLIGTSVHTRKHGEAMFERLNGG